MDLVGLLIALIIICLVFWAARSLLSAFGVGEPVSTVVIVLLVILVVLWLVGLIGGGGLGLGHRALFR